jgi:hypothetical protein
MSTGYVRRKITGQPDWDDRGDPRNERRLARTVANADWDPSEHWGAYFPDRSMPVEIVPEWAQSRAAHRSVKIDGKIMYYWRIIVYPTRQVARAWLWITVTPYRFAAVAAAIGMAWLMINS